MSAVNLVSLTFFCDCALLAAFETFYEKHLIIIIIIIIILIIIIIIIHVLNYNVPGRANQIVPVQQRSAWAGRGPGGPRAGPRKKK